jgi:hypothetical protein
LTSKALPKKKGKENERGWEQNIYSVTAYRKNKNAIKNTDTTLTM